MLFFSLLLKTNSKLIGLASIQTFWKDMLVIIYLGYFPDKHIPES